MNFQNKGFYWFLRSSAAAHTPRMNCDEMARDRLTVFANRNCYRLPRVSWALAQISCLSWFCSPDWEQSSRIHSVWRTVRFFLLIWHSLCFQTLGRLNLSIYPLRTTSARERIKWDWNDLFNAITKSRLRKRTTHFCCTIIFIRQQKIQTKNIVDCRKKNFRACASVL